MADAPAAGAQAEQEQQQQQPQQQPQQQQSVQEGQQLEEPQQEQQVQQHREHHQELQQPQQQQAVQVEQVEQQQQQSQQQAVQTDQPQQPPPDQGTTQGDPQPEIPDTVEGMVTQLLQARAAWHAHARPLVAPLPPDSAAPAVAPAGARGVGAGAGPSARGGAGVQRGLGVKQPVRGAVAGVRRREQTGPAERTPQQPPARRIGRANSATSSRLGVLREYHAGVCLRRHVRCF